MVSHAGGERIADDGVVGPAAFPPPDGAPAVAEPPTAKPSSWVVTVLVWMVVLAIPLASIGGGVFLLYQRAWGTRVEATVLECGLSGGINSGASTYRQDCTASWTIDGHEVVGGFSGGNGDSDVGHTVDATVRGDTAYSRSLLLPVILILLGLPFVVLLAFTRRAKGKPAGSAG
jgi:hypothetical protein